MRGILLLTRAEVNRLRRNKRYLLFTVGLPVILYLIIGQAGDGDGLRRAIRRVLHGRDGHASARSAAR